MRAGGAAPPRALDEGVRIPGRAEEPTAAHAGPDQELAQEGGSGSGPAPPTHAGFGQDAVDVRRDGDLGIAAQRGPHGFGRDADDPPLRRQDPDAAPVPSQDGEESRLGRPRQPGQHRARPGDEPPDPGVGTLDRLRLETQPAGRRLDPAVEPFTPLGEVVDRRDHLPGRPDVQPGPPAEGVQRLAEAGPRPAEFGEGLAHG